MDPQNQIPNSMAVFEQQRGALGYCTLEQLGRIAARGNTILDPFSILISAAAEIGSGNTFYPNVVVECRAPGSLKIGNENVFYPGTLLVADPGLVSVGDSNTFGDGGCTAKANTTSSRIEIGDRGRYVNGPLILGHTRLGSGTQIIGAITVQDCDLIGGTDFTGKNPDLRGAVLKGSGLARKLIVGTGKVINATGVFTAEQVEDQASYHPRGK